MAGLAGCGGGSNNGGGGNTGGGNPTTVTYDFSSGPAPSAVATQIGTGAFTQAAISAGKLTVSIPDGETNYTVVYACPTYTISDVAQNFEGVIRANIQDGSSFSRTCKGLPSSTSTDMATLQVNPAAIPGAAYVSVQGSAQPWTSGTLSVSTLMTAGNSDIAVYVADASGKVLAVRILRNQTIPGVLNGGNPVVFETSDETQLEAISYSSVPAGFSAAPPSIQFNTADGAVVPLGIDVTTQYPAIASAAVQSGDYYSFGGEAFNGGSNEYVAVQTNTASGGSQVLNLPAGWTYAGPSPAALPTFNFDYTGFSGKPDVSDGADLNWWVGTTSENQFAMSATASYQNGATSLSVPGLSGLTGFLAPAPTGTKVVWTAQIYQGILSAGSGSQSIVIDSGSYTEP